MNLIFPFKNLVINHLLEFYEKEKVKNFFDLKHGKNHLDNDYIEFITQDWRNQLPNFENEILQTINTTDQSTINAYFVELNGNLEYIKSCNNAKYFKQKILTLG